MLDLNFIKENLDQVKDSVRQRGLEVDVDAFINLVDKRATLLRQVEDLRAERNKLSKSNKGSAPAPATVERSFDIKQELKNLEPALKTIEADVENLQKQIPNILSPTVVEGEGEAENEEIKSWGKKPTFKFEPKDHEALGEALDLIDIKKGAEVSGSGFSYLKNEAALMEFALIKYVSDILVTAGYTPLIVPALVREETAEGTGYLPREQEPDIYKIEGEDLYLSATAEMPLTSYHAHEVLEEKDLPKKYWGFSSCFRKEAGTYGKHKKGIFRQHQFDKVEIYRFERPEDSEKAFEELVALEEKIFQGLEIPYRIVSSCSGDMSAPACIKYDLEYWSPVDKTYRELTSCSSCTDYQARRLDIRYKDAAGDTKFVHTLNGTAVAIGRTLVAILENYQQEDGSVKIPKVLQKYVGKKKIAWRNLYLSF